MKCGIKKILIWLLSFSLMLPSFSVSIYANEIPQELEITSSLEENKENQAEDIEEDLEVEEETFVLRKALSFFVRLCLISLEDVGSFCS